LTFERRDVDHLELLASVYQKTVTTIADDTQLSE
jgi:hypothetical protein